MWRGLSDECRGCRYEVWQIRLNDIGLPTIGPTANSRNLLMASPDLSPPPACIDLNASQCGEYGSDWTRRYPIPPCGVALPRSIEDVVEVVEWAAANDVGLVPSGGRTGSSGGAVASQGELVLSLDRMRRVLGFDAVDRTLTVETGVTTQQAQQEAEERGLFYPVDFASRGSSQIGGNIATNAGGIKVMRYGMTRNWVSGLKVVTGTGTGAVLDLKRNLVKNATGYDLRHLLMDSEGTIGVIVEATLQLTDPPPQPQVMVLAVPGLDALMRVYASLRVRLTLNAFEFFDTAALRYVTVHGERGLPLKPSRRTTCSRSSMRISRAP